ncbi:MAG: PA4642 family protein [Gammaproteobacteria bacterium]|nr:PA4642 family protein [Gammaproteobacteria bacterium]
MASRPDKQQIIDEVWDDARVESFLHRTCHEDDLDADFFVLWQAYQAMREGDFRRFLRMFVAAGRNLDAVNEHGETLATMISTHRHGAPFIDALMAAGAKAPAKGVSA